MSTDNQKGPGSNNDKQDIDKAPGEERGKSEEVKTGNLKGKNVDADPTTDEGKPLGVDQA